MSNFIYLDHHATTPCDPRVVEAMLPFFSTHFGNPSSAHEAGRVAADAVQNAREEVAALLSAKPGEIFFTSGATESNNLALLGLARAFGHKRKRIVTTPVEHKAVLEPCRWLEKQEFDLTYLPVDGTGEVDLFDQDGSLFGGALFVSIQAANHEVGSIQPVPEVAQLAHERGAFVHCDAAQAVGKIPLDVRAWDVDLLSLSGHKMYGPKGVGALYVRGGKRSGLSPLVFGGGQEGGLRPGTLNVPGIVGLGEAARLCHEEMNDEAARLSKLRDEFEAALVRAVPDLLVNGATKRLPHSSNLCFPGIEVEALLANVPNLALSTGSACTSGALEPSQVLTAIGLSREEAHNTIRVGLGRSTTQAQMQSAAHQIVQVVGRLAKLGMIR